MLSTRGNGRNMMTAKLIVAFVGIVRFLFWLPVLTIYLADSYVKRSDRSAVVCYVLLGWSIVVTLLTSLAVLDSSLWLGIIILYLVSYLPLGAVTLGSVYLNDSLRRLPA